MPERIKLSIKLTIDMDADLDHEDTLEILKENLENFQYTIGVKRIDVKMDKPRLIKIYNDILVIGDRHVAMTSLIGDLIDGLPIMEIDGTTLKSIGKEDRVAAAKEFITPEILNRIKRTCNELDKL